MLRVIACRLLILAALLSACSEAALELESHTCSVDSDCLMDEQCTYGHCAMMGTNNLVLHARLIPPVTSGLVQQQLPELDLSQGAAQTIALIEPIQLQGVVRYEANAATSNIPGTLEAWTSGDIPGLDYRFTTDSSDGFRAEREYGYELMLLPGREYETVFRSDTQEDPQVCHG